MPTLISENEIRLEWPDVNEWGLRTHKIHKRSKGVHLSGVIKYVLTTSGLLAADEEEQASAGDVPSLALSARLLRMFVGMCWEAGVVGLWPEIDWQPGQVALDGVTGSPDGITRSTKTLEEFKATWKSSHTRPDITKEKLWMWQLMGYCKMLGLLRARLHVLWLNGSYRPPSPRYVTYLIEFTQAELDKFWANVIVKNKEHAIPEGE